MALYQNLSRDAYHVKFFDNCPAVYLLCDRLRCTQFDHAFRGIGRLVSEDKLLIYKDINSNSKEISMAIEAFSEVWAHEWCRVLNGRSAYQTAAATWEGAVALVMTRDGSVSPESRAVFLDLWHGQCRAARIASPDDLDSVRYILSGTAPAWRAVLSGTVAPLTAMMTGKIRLTKGNMASLVPFAAAARELVVAAMEMEVSFPDGW